MKSIPDLGQRLESLRRAGNLSRRELAKQMGVSPPTLDRVTRNSGKLSRATERKLALFVKVNEAVVTKFTASFRGRSKDPECFAELLPVSTAEKLSTREAELLGEFINLNRSIASRLEVLKKFPVLWSLTVEIEDEDRPLEELGDQFRAVLAGVSRYS